MRVHDRCVGPCVVREERAIETLQHAVLTVLSELCRLSRWRLEKNRCPHPPQPLLLINSAAPCENNRSYLYIRYCRVRLVLLYRLLFVEGRHKSGSETLFTFRHHVFEPPSNQTKSRC